MSETIVEEANDMEEAQIDEQPPPLGSWLFEDDPYTIEVGRVLVTDAHTGEEAVQFKAVCDGYTHRSDDVTAAVMGALQQATNGDLT